MPKMHVRPAPKRICARIGWALFCMLLAWNAAALGLQWWVQHAAPGLLFNQWAPWLLSSAPLFLVGLPVFMLVLRSLPNGPTILRWKLPFGAKQYALGMLFCLGFSYSINLITTGLLLIPRVLSSGGAPGSNPVQEMVLQGGFFPNFIFGVLVPAVGEEFIFRKLIRRKMRGCPDSTYLLFSALCFALFHGNITQGLYTFAAGAIFAWAYVMSGKFWVPVSMHFLMNGIGILPAMMGENTTLTILLGLAILGIVAGSVIVFFACKGAFLASLQPPAVAAWPYRPRGHRAQNAAYTAWYAAYACGRADGPPPPIITLPGDLLWMAASGQGRTARAGPGYPQAYAHPYAPPPPPPGHPFWSLLCNVGMLLFIGLSVVFIVLQFVVFL